MARDGYDDLSRARRQLAAQQSVIDKLKAIRALWIGGHTTPVPVEKTAQEFYWAVGDLLEGAPLDKVVAGLKHIDGQEVLHEVKDSG
jgi:hypothetical protein